MLKALTRLLKAEGFTVQAFNSAKTFLESYRPETLGCLVLDVAMPELNGLELQHRLTRSGFLLPIVFLTGHGDIPMSVQAIKAGAVDFLTKPVKDADLLRAVRAALQRAVEQRDFIAEIALLRQRYASLTPREAEVMAHVVAGQLNKQVAGDLGHWRAHHQNPSRPGDGKDGSRIARRPRPRRGTIGPGKTSDQ